MSHHANCGTEFFTDEVIWDLLARSLEKAALGADGFTDVATGPGSTEAKYIDWLTISDNVQSVVEDAARIRSHPLVPGSIPSHVTLEHSSVRSGPRSTTSPTTQTAS